MAVIAPCNLPPEREVIVEKLQKKEKELDILLHNSGEVFVVRVNEQADGKVCCFLKEVKTKGKAHYELCNPENHAFQNSWCIAEPRPSPNPFSMFKTNYLDLELVQKNFTVPRESACKCDKANMKKIPVQEMSQKLQNLNSSFLLLSRNFLKQTEAVKTYIERGEPYLGVVTDDLKTPLHLCCWFNELETFKLLVSYGFDFSKKDISGKLAFQYVFEGERNSKMIDYFLGEGGRLLINYFAMENSSSPVSVIESIRVQLLSSNCYMTTEDRSTFMDFLRFTAENIGQFKHHLNSVSENNISLLKWLVRYDIHANFEKEIDTVLALKPVVDKTDHQGYTALHNAVVHGRIETTKKLLSAGADPTKRVHPLNPNVKHGTDVSKKVDAHGLAVYKLNLAKKGVCPYTTNQEGIAKYIENLTVIAQFLDKNEKIISKRKKLEEARDSDNSWVLVEQFDSFPMIDNNCLKTVKLPNPAIHTEEVVFNCEEESESLKNEDKKTSVQESLLEQDPRKEKVFGIQKEYIGDEGL